MFPYCRILAVLTGLAVVNRTALARRDADDDDCRCLRCQTALFAWPGGEVKYASEVDPNEPLVTDRPDFTEASTTVGLGTLQLEAGYTYVQDRANGDLVQTHSFPETFLRMGLFAEWFEMRLAWNYNVVPSRVGSERFTDDGAVDLYMSWKIALTKQQGLLPEMVIMPQMTVPTGAAAFTAHEVQAGVSWLYGWEVLDWLACGGSTQLNRRLNTFAEDYGEMAQSFTINYSLSDKLGAYTEWFAFFPSGANDAAVSTQHYLDGGFTYRVTINFQLDIRAGIGISEASDDFFAGSGFSVRF